GSKANSPGFAVKPQDRRKAAVDTGSPSAKAERPSARTAWSGKASGALPVSPSSMVISRWRHADAADKSCKVTRTLLLRMLNGLQPVHYAGAICIRCNAQNGVPFGAIFTRFKAERGRPRWL